MIGEVEEDILMDESALSAEARERLAQIGHADILVGVPSHRNGRTIGEVVRAIKEGIAQDLSQYKVVFMNADGGSSDNTVRRVNEVAMPPNVEKFLVTYQGPTGKGTAIHAILEAAATLQVRACVVVEARAPGIAPEWVSLLAEPVLAGEAQVAMAYYQRSAYAASLVDNLIFPFFHTFLRTDLRDPVASEFCLSGEVARDLACCDVWETEVARFGFNVWMATQALVQEWPLVQVNLGYRGDPSGEPGALLDARFLHTVGTMFRFLSVHREFWLAERPFLRVPKRGLEFVEKDISSPECLSSLASALWEGKKRSFAEWEKIFSPEPLAELLETVTHFEERGFPISLWASLVMEAALIYNQGEGDPDKVVEALLPIFHGRTAAYLAETRGMSPREREK
ncbi:MAG: hypothetical protein J7M05_05135, partial [Anaerolineae bacterium]|nr:hypothetical protein [Anaerolineae bacterium]